MEISFLKKYLNQILNFEDTNEQFKKIISIYDMMNGKNINVINDND